MARQVLVMLDSINTPMSKLDSNPVNDLTIMPHYIVCARQSLNQYLHGFHRMYGIVNQYLHAFHDM